VDDLRRGVHGHPDRVLVLATPVFEAVTSFGGSAQRAAESAVDRNAFGYPLGWHLLPLTG
jgi:hypothetical protein